MLRSSLYNGFVEGHFDNIGEAGDVENKNNNKLRPKACAVKGLAKSLE